MNLSIKINPFNFTVSKLKTKEINKGSEPAFSADSKNIPVFADMLHNKLLVKNKAVSFGSCIQEDKAFKAEVDSLKKKLTEQKIEPGKIKKIINFLNEAGGEDPILDNFMKKIRDQGIELRRPFVEKSELLTDLINEKTDKLIPKNNFEKIQCFADASFDEFVEKNNGGKEVNPKLLNTLKEVYSLYAIREELQKLSKYDLDLFREENIFSLRLDAPIGDELTGIMSKISEKRKEKINLYGLNSDSAAFVKKAKKDLKVELKIPNSPELAKYTYELFADYKKFGYKLPEVVDLVNIEDFIEYSWAEALYFKDEKKAGYNPYNLSEDLSKGNLMSSRFVTSFRESMQHEVVGHFMHNVNIGESKYDSPESYEFTSLSGRDEQKALKEFESLFFESPDPKEKNPYNLLNLIDKFDKAKKNYEKNPDSPKSFSSESYRDVILPAFEKLQNLNTIIDMSFSEDKFDGNYAKKNAHELVAVAAELSNKYQYVPAFQRIVDKIGMYPLKDRERLSPDSPISEALKYKDELLDKLINLRNKEGKPVFSGESLAKIMEHITPEKQIVLDKILESRKDEISVMTGGEEIAEIIENG